MDNTLMTIIGIFLAALLMFIVPLMIISERNDDIAQSVVQTATADFVDTISIAGAIRPNDYEAYLQKLAATGNTFDVQIEVQHLDENFGKKDDSSSVGNQRYSTFTTEILNSMYPNDGTSKNYALKKGDNVIVTAKNNNKTIAQTLRSFIYKVTGQGTYQIGASSSSRVINNETVIGYTETNNIQRPQEPQVPEVDKPLIDSWEQDGTIIYGKDTSGNTVVTLHIGDFVNYNHKSGNSYTSPGANNGVKDQNFTTDVDVKWRAMGVDDGNLLLICSTTVGTILVSSETEDDLDKITDELNKVSEIFKNTYANNARSVNTDDIIELCRIYGNDVSEYGKTNARSWYSFSSTNDFIEDWGGGEPDYNKGRFTNCAPALLVTLFGDSSFFLPNKVIANDYVYGIYTVQPMGYLNYAWTYKNDVDWPDGRGAGVRPVIELGTGFGMEKQGNEWDIIE